MMIKDKKELLIWLRNKVNGKYTINFDDSIDVVGDVLIEDLTLEQLPVMFNKVSGSFKVLRCGLKNLAGFPAEVGLDFSCASNKIKSLELGPKKVGRHYDCSSNQLKSLLYIPQDLTGIIMAYKNKFQSLNHLPKNIKSIYIEGFIENLNIEYGEFNISLHIITDKKIKELFNKKEIAELIVVDEIYDSKQSKMIKNYHINLSSQQVKNIYLNNTLAKTIPFKTESKKLKL